MHRNELCSCGSGKRYKHCHGVQTIKESARAAVAQDAESGRDPGNLLNDALNAQRAGDLRAAESLYEAALRVLPGHFDALHMLGVVKIQLGKFDEARRRLIEAVPLVPDSAQAMFKHNLSLCLTGLARERGLLTALTRPSAIDAPPAPFVHAMRDSEVPYIERGTLSVILAAMESADDVERSLDSIRAAARESIEIIVPVEANGVDTGAIDAAIATRGLQGRVLRTIEASAAERINAAARVASGRYLSLMRAGDRWTPHWAAHLVAAMRSRQTMWGFSGIRVTDANGAPVAYGREPDTDRLLRAQDELYAHATPSLALLGFNPIAEGRNLIVLRDWWSESGGFRPSSRDPFLDWAWEAAQRHEPLYLDEPDYLIAQGTVGVHVHDSTAAMLAQTARIASVGVAAPDRRQLVVNRHMSNGVARFWARQWEQIFALQATVMPLLVLHHCANMLEVAAQYIGSSPV